MQLLLDRYLYYGIGLFWKDLAKPQITYILEILIKFK